MAWFLSLVPHLPLCPLSLLLQPWLPLLPNSCLPWVPLVLMLLLMVLAGVLVRLQLLVQVLVLMQLLVQFCWNIPLEPHLPNPWGLWAARTLTVRALLLQG